MLKVDKYRYKFVENDIELIAEKHTLIDLAKMLREANVEGTWGDLIYQIEYAFNVDGIRSKDEDDEEDIDMLYHDASEDELRKMGAFDNLHEEDYMPSSTSGDYSPSNPWDAPGNSISMFIGGVYD